MKEEKKPNQNQVIKINFMYMYYKLAPYVSII